MCSLHKVSCFVCESQPTIVPSPLPWGHQWRYHHRCTPPEQKQPPTFLPSCSLSLYLYLCLHLFYVTHKTPDSGIRRKSFGDRDICTIFHFHFHVSIQTPHTQTLIYIYIQYTNISPKYIINILCTWPSINNKYVCVPVLLLRTEPSK